MTTTILRILLSLIIYLAICFYTFSQGTNNKYFPQYKSFKSKPLTIDNFNNWYKKITNDDNFSYKIESETDDELGFKHKKINQYYNNIKIENAVYILHTKNNLIESVSGYLYTTAPLPNYRITTTNNNTRKIFKLENNDIHFTNSSLIYIENEGGNLVLCYEYIINDNSNSLSEKVYVNTETNEIERRINNQHFLSIPTEVETNLSGKRIINTNYSNGIYTLLDSTRGNGIETLSLQNQTLISEAKPIIDSTNTWNSFSNKIERSALDVHFGAISTYDYFLKKHNRNSIDNKGYKLTNIVHYGQNFVNAYWDGTKMIFGDGDSKIGPLVSLDIIGHEITHGLTSNTAKLLLENEPGALNESFSDIFGVVIDFFTRPEKANWSVGEEVSPLIRSFENPTINNDPDTYYGKNWKPIGGADFGGIHSNNGVQNYWFYLLANGGNGINDKNDTFNIVGIGIDKAAQIVFRNLVYYLTPQSNFNDARLGSISAAEDLYGSCSNEVESVTNAWYAVGVGKKYQTFIKSDFEASYTKGCDSLNVNFFNLSQNSKQYEWDFGDGTFSYEYEPRHSFKGEGFYNVKLIAYGDTVCNIKDSLTKVDYIQISKSDLKVNNLTHTTCVLPSVFKPTILLDTLSTLNWYDKNKKLISTGLSYTFKNKEDTLITFEPNHYKLGMTNSNLNTAFYNFNVRHLVFDVFEPLIIESVEVNAQSAGERIFEIKDPFGNVIQSKKINIPAGVSRVLLNFKIDPGLDYQFGIGGNLIGLSRSNSGVKYPYEIKNLISIKRSNAQNAGFDFYYFFYNWDIKKIKCATENYITKLKIDQKNIINPIFDIKKSYCIGDTIDKFPSNSLNNIIGSWFPSPNNQKTTTYQFVPNIDQCATTTELTISINNKITPDFSNINTACDTMNLKKLPMVSNNNISGTWELIDNNNLNSNYLFTPSSGVCATNSILSFQKTNLDTIKIRNEDGLLNIQIDTNLNSVNWFDCISNVPLINSNKITFEPTKEGSYSVIISNKTCKIIDTIACYLYSTQSIENHNIISYKISPNPFNESILISNLKGNIENYTIEIKSADGKIVFKKEFNNEPIITTELNAGIYFISVINTKTNEEFSSKIVKL